MKTIKIFLIASILVTSINVFGQSDNKRERQRQNNLRQLQLVSSMMGTDGNSTEIQQQENVKDIDGNEYRTVKVKDKEWMIDKLRVTRYNNGDSIKFVSEDQIWQSCDSLKMGMCCVYENNADYIDNYGLLYNYYCVIDKRGIAPVGWHVATLSDWIDLKDVILQYSTNKGFDIDVLNYKSSYFNLNELVGYRNADGEYRLINKLANYWLAKSNNDLIANNIPMVSLCYLDADLISTVDESLNESEGDFNVGCTILCVKDALVKVESNTK